MSLKFWTDNHCEKIKSIECEICIPAARPDVIDENNVNRLKAKLVIDGANIPITYGAEKYLHEKVVLYVPDFIANAGRVICAAMEYQGACQSAAFQAIEEKVCRNTRLVLEDAATKGIQPREGTIEKSSDFLIYHPSYPTFSSYLQIVNYHNVIPHQLPVPDPHCSYPKLHQDLKNSHYTSKKAIATANHLSSITPT